MLQFICRKDVLLNCDAPVHEKAQLLDNVYDNLSSSTMLLNDDVEANLLREFFDILGQLLTSSEHLIQLKALKCVKIASVKIHNEEVLHNLVPYISRCLQLGSSDLIKEGVITILQHIINNISSAEESSEQLLFSLEEILKCDDKHIFITTIKTVSVFAKRFPQAFRSKEDNFIRILLRSLKHRLFDVRLSVIQCSVDVVLHSENNHVDEFCDRFTHMFDDQPAIRMAIYNAVTAWYFKLPNRTLLLPHVIPIFLFSLSDDAEENKAYGARTWIEIGQHFAREKFGVLNDFVNDLPTHQGVTFGCSAIVQRSLFLLMPRIIRNLTWANPNTLAAWADVMRLTIYHSGIVIAEYSKDIIKIGVRILLENRTLVLRNKINESFKSMSMQTPFSVVYRSWSELLHSQNPCNHDVYLHCLAALLEGTSTENVHGAVDMILDSFTEPNFFSIRHIDTIGVLINTYSYLYVATLIKPNRSRYYKMFVASIHLYAFCPTEDLRKQVTKLLTNFAKMIGLSSITDLCLLFQQQLLGDIKTLLVRPVNLANVITTLCTYVQLCGTESEVICTPKLIKIFSKILDEKNDTPLRFHFLLELCKLFSSKGNDFSEKVRKKLRAYSCQIYESVFKPVLRWKPGRVSEVMRSTCLALWLCLARDFDFYKSFRRNKRVLKDILVCADSNNTTTRVICMHLAGLLFDSFPDNHDLDNRIYFLYYKDIIGRLEDEVDTVRIKACETLRKLIRVSRHVLSSNLADIEVIIDILRCHSMDANQKLKSEVLATIEEILPHRK